MARINIVTGAASGIGFSLAAAMIRRGDTVVLARQIAEVGGEIVQGPGQGLQHEPVLDHGVEVEPVVIHRRSLRAVEYERKANLR